jgi:hypothetical protein
LQLQLPATGSSLRAVVLALPSSICYHYLKVVGSQYREHSCTYDAVPHFKALIRDVLLLMYFQCAYVTISNKSDTPTNLKN